MRLLATFTALQWIIQDKVLDFDSVLATEDGIAVGAVKYAKIKGLFIPEELSVTGYNNSILALASDLELTSVDSKLGIMCRKTVERMISLLENETQIEKNVTTYSLVDNMSGLPDWVKAVHEVEEKMNF